MTGYTTFLSTVNAPFRMCVWLLWFLNYVHPVSSIVQTVLIDNDRGDLLTGRRVIYEPPNGWIQSPSCDACEIRDSWHETKGDSPADVSNATLSFLGTAIDIYSVPQTKTTGVEPDVYFSIDGGSLVQVDPENVNTLFNTTLKFSIKLLPPGQHEVVVQVLGISRFVFNYAVYSYDTEYINTLSATPASAISSGSQAIPSQTSLPASSTHKHSLSSPVSAGIGIACAVVALLTILLLMLWYRRRLAQRRTGPENTQTFTLGTPDPFSDPAPTDVDFLVFSTLVPREAGTITGPSMVQTQTTLPSYRPLDGARPPTYCTNGTVPTAVYKS